MGSTGVNTTSNTGVPSTMPDLQTVLAAAKALKGPALTQAITELEWDGDWYREDKRSKRSFVEGVVQYNYVQDPAAGNSGSSITDQVDTNRKILSAVYGMSRHSKEFSDRFGHYDIDRLYQRAAERRNK